MAEFGVLTMATSNDYLKALGLSLSIRKHNPDVKIAIACYKDVSDKIGKYFDYVIEQRHDLKGFEHKVYLDEYSPFDKTFFFDADVLFFKSLNPVYEEWKGRAYTARGVYESVGVSSFGLDFEIALAKIGKDKLVRIGGAGHAYFEKPACKDVFNLARKITKDYTNYANPCKYADEDVMAIAMTILDLKPMKTVDFQSRLLHAIPGSFRMNVVEGVCTFSKKENQFKALEKGRQVSPYMVHFATREGALVYRRALSQIFKENGIAMEYELWCLAFSDLKSTFVIKLKKSVKKFFNWCAFKND